MDPLIGSVNETVDLGSNTQDATLIDGPQELQQVQQVEISTQDSTPNTAYSNPNTPYPATPPTYGGAPTGGSGGGGASAQIVIYNDPRAALAVISQFGLGNTI